MVFPYKDIRTATVNQSKGPFCPVYYFHQCLNTDVWEYQRDGTSAAFLQLPSQGPTISAQRPPSYNEVLGYLLNFKGFPFPELLWSL